MNGHRRRKPGYSARFVLLAGLLTGLAAGAFYVFTRDTPEKLYRRAQALLPSNPREAERLLEQSVEAADGDYPEAQLLWTQVLAGSGRWNEALGCFSLIEDPSACETEELIELAEQAGAANVPLLAGMALDAANRPGPHRGKVLRMLIPLRLREGRHDGVVALCRELVELAPDDPRPWRIIANVHQKRREITEAIDAYRAALQRNPPAAEARQIRRELAGPLIDIGDAEAARRVMDRLLADGAPSEGDRIRHAYLLRLEGRTDEALREAEHVLARRPSAGGALLLRGTLRLDRGDFAGAADDLERLVEQEPFNKEAHYKLGQAFLRLNRTEEARNHLDKSRELTEISLRILDLQPRIERDPRNRELRNELADLYERSGRPEQAARWRRSAPPRREESSR